MANASNHPRVPHPSPLTGLRLYERPEKVRYNLAIVSLRGCAAGPLCFMRFLT